MTSINTRLDEFHEKYGMPVRQDLLEGLKTKEGNWLRSQKLTLLWMSQYAKVQDQGLLCRFSLMSEEFAEFLDALLEGDRQEIAKEGADLLVTVIGTLALLGIDAEDAFNRVMDSNMTKPEGYSLTQRDKGPDYKAPDFSHV